MAVAGCSSKAHRPSSDGTQEPMDGGEPDTGPSYDHEGGTPGARACDLTPCAAGQICDDSTGAAVCTPSCAAVSCGSGTRCEIVGRYATCVEHCDPACGQGQRCEGHLCVDNTCDELDCGATEACVAAGSGSGTLCVDNTCEDDVGCAQSETCAAGICTGDVCVAGARRCDGEVVRECAANGGGELTRVTCSAAAYVESDCVDDGSSAYCSCRDDWDCPEHTRCARGHCDGTGRPAHCYLPPTGFASLLPEDEPGFPWGGDDSDGYAGKALMHGSPVRSRDAAGHPFPRHAQVTTTPVVANLDDDNGDGLVDERDLPEIVFTSFCDTNYYNHGVLRAVHGGGAQAGQELFARCLDKLWQQGDALVDEQGGLVDAASCGCDEGDLEPTGAVAVGDLDGDGLPEIVVTGHDPAAGLSNVTNGRVLIFSRRGELISDNAVGALAGANQAITLANVDGAGLVEIVVGARVLFLDDKAGPLSVSHVLVGNAGQGVNNGQGAVSCAADLDADGRMEIVAGGTVYKLPAAPSEACPSDTSGLSEEAQAYCGGQLQVLWSAGVDGFCAIADVLAARASADEPEPLAGAGAPLDGEPEVVLVSNGRLRIYAARSGLARVDVPLTSGAGGPPNVDDFDGDGFPEIGTAGSTAYVLYDLQPPTEACPAWPNELDGAPAGSAADSGNPARLPPDVSCSSSADCGDAAQFACGKQGRCVCLHNAWQSRTQDASSNVTGSSVFDFNGDGAAEVVYNDECYFRIYDGSTGSVYQRLDSQSPTRIEYPVVADVDNDGNAEIVFSAGNARSESCPSQGLVSLPNGLRVIGDPSDRWVAARRIWNQHAYHVTNVLESGAIPSAEVPSWLSYAGRPYNTYRSNLPPFGHVAPDLAVSAIGVTSPDVACGEPLSSDIRIVARIVNQGDLRVGQGVLVRFYDQADNLLGESPLGVGLMPAGEVRVTLDYHASNPQALPSQVRVVVDAAEQERECVEDNNSLTQPLIARDMSPELVVSLEQQGEACPVRHLLLQVKNTGTSAVQEVPVRLYAGDPSAGGTLLSENKLGPIDAQAEVSLELDVDAANRDLSVFAVVNPDSSVVECDESNNTAQTEVRCSVELQ